MTDNIKTNEVAEQTSFNMEKYRFKKHRTVSEFL